MNSPTSEKKRVLITVKTYPSLSTKYDELVCTAGITEEGEWIRLYPIPFRKLQEDQRYKKYQWIEIEVIKNSSDPRKESYRPLNLENVIIENFLDTNDKWNFRKEIVLKNVYSNLENLIQDNKNDEGVSLAVFKPTKILDFSIKKTDRNWDPKKLKAVESKAKQLNLFEQNDNPFKIMPKLPYDFKYIFEDIKGKRSELLIEDWEVGQLYWNTLKSSSNEEIACEKVKEKYFDLFSTKDIYFFMGTKRQFDKWTKNPFSIIGVFYPPKNNQQKLF